MLEQRRSGIQKRITNVIVAFTGHRPDKLGGYGSKNPIRAALLEAIKIELKNIHAVTPIEETLSGMALGVDQWAADVALDLGIPLCACIPFEGQEKLWPFAAQARYAQLIARATERVVVCEGGYAAWKMQRRNEYMVDCCDLLIAIFDGSKGGTKNCVDYALSIDKPVRFICPRPGENWNAWARANLT